jgi:hypothetical protein
MMPTDEAPRKPLSEMTEAERENWASTKLQKVMRGNSVRKVPLIVHAAHAAQKPEEVTPWMARWAMIKLLGTSAAKAGGYLLLGGLVYGYAEPNWTAIDAIYFSVATMTTVGYGDLSPTTTALRGFTLFMIFAGVVFVLADVASVLGALTAPITACGRAKLETMFPQVAVDINGDGNGDYYQPRPPLVYYSKNLLPSLVLNLGVQILSAFVFVAIEPGWGFFDAFYHTLVTATTVGYGDQTIATQGGKVFSCFHMTISVVLLGELIGTLDELRVKRADTLKRIAQLQRPLDEAMLISLTARSIELRPMVERDGKGLTELEFAITMLMELEIVDVDVIRPFIKQFRYLDIDGGGRVGIDDLRMLKRLPSEKIEEMRRTASKRKPSLVNSLSLNSSPPTSPPKVPSLIPQPLPPLASDPALSA